MGEIFKMCVRLFFVFAFAELFVQAVYVVQNPFPWTIQEQQRREVIGMDNMSYMSNTLVPALTQKIIAARVSPESYIQENFTYISDYQNYGIRDFWAYPDETISRMSGDCEDYAILEKSVVDYVYKNTKVVKVMTQPNHAYVSVDNSSVWKIADEPEQSQYDRAVQALTDYFDFGSMPIERTVIIIILFICDAAVLMRIFEKFDL